jgi:hypothetical protein
MVGFYFREVMEGRVEREGERFDRPFRFEVDVNAPRVLDFAKIAVGKLDGHLRLDGLARRAGATGRIELSPFGERRIRYVLDFTADDGKRYTFDGSKSIRGLTFTRGWTHLPGEVRAAEGGLYGRAVLRFSLRRHLAGLLKSIRLTRGAVVH